MDAAEADADVKLYKASAELLSELQAKVPRLVTYTKDQTKFRRWVISSKVYEVTRLLDAFQEWPQLLDPYLSSLVEVLVNAYLSYCVRHANGYIREHNLSDQVIPLPRAVARVLYAFCKVRGQKIIVRLLNNEPKYVECLLSCFRLWTAQNDVAAGAKAEAMTWEERYIHLLWLSHLMLAPFELSTVSALSVDLSAEVKYPELYIKLPDVSINLLMVGLDHIHESSKAREAASTLLVRLILRSDMQKLGMMERLVKWILIELQSPVDALTSTGYRYIGLLELLFGIINSASDSEAAPFLGRVFQLAHKAADSSEMHFQAIRDSAPARKLLVKIMRSTVVHAIQLQAMQSVQVLFDLNEMLESSIQVMLEYLADKDTPVRYAASKALSLICLKLDIDMSSEVVEAVIDSLHENMLLEDLKSGELFPHTDVARSASAIYKKSVNAVDPLKWHGCMLTLGHLLFRRSLPTTQLQVVIEALLMGLEFEQRSNIGTSIGVGVRDAACFGIWSLARKYSTLELNEVSISASLLPTRASVNDTGKISALQLIAMHLATSACLDPSGNLRRGSSAALQELIGRHPDVIEQGIPVVQTIDYHAVARRSRAVTEVAIAASKLSSHYHNALLYALLKWRGARATDADSRRQAARAIGMLISTATREVVLAFLDEVILNLSNLRMANSGSNAAARHGLMCCLATSIQNISNSVETLGTMMPVIQNIDAIVGTINGRVTADIENVLEGTSELTLALADVITQATIGKASSVAILDPSNWASSMLPILDRCTTASDKNIVADVAAQANIKLMSMVSKTSRKALLTSWLDQRLQNKFDFTCKGRILTLGQIVQSSYTALTLEELQLPVVQYLSDIIHGSYPIEVKVNAMQSIGLIMKENSQLASERLSLLVEAVYTGLTDYTTDQRGDIGSLLRLESINAASKLASLDENLQSNPGILQQLAKLAAGRLVKVRFEAWKCLEGCSIIDGTKARHFEHQADVSSSSYFRNLLDLLYRSQIGEQVLVGLMSSMFGSTEEVFQACSEAMITFAHDQDEKTRQLTIDLIVTFVARHVVDIAKAEDHDVVPVVDFLAFLVEHVMEADWILANSTVCGHIWTVCETVQSPSSTIVRLEAMIRLYAALLPLESLRLQALDRLTRLLLHRWPKIRGAAADAICMHTTAQAFMTCDWNASATTNKPAVLALRKELNIAASNLWFQWDLSTRIMQSDILPKWRTTA